jgi:hypothetical protein
LRGRIAAFQPVVDQNLLLNLAGDWAASACA